MSALSAPAGGDRDRATELNSFAWTWFSISTVFIAARVYSRLKLTRNFWYDDAFIVFTLALTLAFTILLTILGQLGGCRHLYYLEMDPQQAIKAARLNWITQPVVIYALGTGKISVAFLILRIMGKSKWRKAFLIYGAMIGSSIVCTVTSILTFVQCRPVSALWNTKLVATGQATCWPPHRQSDFSLFAGSMSGYLAFIDLALALLPITIMWNLRLSVRKKVGISAVLGLGVFACICACIKTSKLPELNARADITFITVTLWIWNVNECNVVIIAACIPTLRPLFLIIFKRPGRDNYRHRKSYNPGSNRPKRVRGVSAPISDSTTAIGYAEDEGSWIELGPDQHSSHGDREIRQTLEFDVTSHKKTMSPAGDRMPPTTEGNEAC